MVKVFYKREDVPDLRPYAQQLLVIRWAHQHVLTSATAAQASALRARSWGKAVQPAGCVLLRPPDAATSCLSSLLCMHATGGMLMVKTREEAPDLWPYAQNVLISR